MRRLLLQFYLPTGMNKANPESWICKIWLPVATSLTFKYNTPSLNTNLTEAAEAKAKGGDFQQSLNHLDK